MLLSDLEEDIELENLLKNIRNICIMSIIDKQNSNHCNRSRLS